MAETNISMRHVRVFLEIVGQRSLRRAAASLHITESAVSKSLRELEEELDAVLMTRDRRGISLTGAGEDFHRHAAQSFASFAKAIDVVKGRALLKESVRIGALPTAAASIVPHAVQRLLQRSPELKVEVVSGAFDYLVSRLRLGELDLLVGRMISRDTLGLAFERLYDEDVVVVVRRNHPIAAQDVINVKALAAWPVIAPGAGTQVRAMVDDFLFASQARSTLNLIESQSETFSRAYACTYDAIWFVPAGVIEVDLRLGTLVRLPLQSELLRAPIGVTTLQASQEKPATAAFIRVLRDHCSASGANAAAAR